MKCKRKYLFCCESSFQLFNAINIKMNLFQKEKADFIFIRSNGFFPLLLINLSRSKFLKMFVL